MMARILIISKTPLLQRMAEPDLLRMIAAGAADAQLLQGAAKRHDHSLHEIRAALTGHEVSQQFVEHVVPGQRVDVDAIVTVGGDGSVLTAASLLSDAPMFTVNSDPIGSVGHYTRCRAESFPALFALWLAGRHRSEVLARLDAVVAGQRWPFLNDLLFANPNPAAMCRYRLETPSGTSRQRSSGVWVSTATGSTGAIRSAGMAVCREREALLFKVREPFDPPPNAQLEARQVPPQWLHLTPAAGGAVCYLDGPNRALPLAPGDSVRIEPSAHPLHLVTSAPSHPA